MSPPSRPRVAFLVKRFPRLSETFVLHEFLELRRQGFAIELFALMDPAEAHVQPEAETLRSEVRYLRDPTGRLPVQPIVMAALRHPLGTARALRFLRDRSAASRRHLGEALVLVHHVDRGRFSHLHAHFAHSPAAVAHLVHLVTGIPFSFTAHAKDLYTTRPGHVAARAHAAAFVSTCTAANAIHLVEELGVPAEKVVLCRHGVNLVRFLDVHGPPVAGRILSVGRLVPKKGFDVLIRACAGLRDQGVPFSCTIVGDGPERPALEGLVAGLGLADRVRLEHGCPQPALVAHFRAAEIFALSPIVTDDGDRDGVPNVILEAMAAGVPVIASATSGIPEAVVHDANGWLVASRDPAALADGLAALLADRATRARLGSSGREHVATEFEWGRCITPLVRALDAGRREGTVVAK